MFFSACEQVMRYPISKKNRKRMKGGINIFLEKKKKNSFGNQLFKLRFYRIRVCRTLNTIFNRNKSHEVVFAIHIAVPKTRKIHQKKKTIIIIRYLSYSPREYTEIQLITSHHMLKAIVECRKLGR